MSLNPIFSYLNANKYQLFIFYFLFILKKMIFFFRKYFHCEKKFLSLHIENEIKDYFGYFSVEILKLNVF